MDPPAPSAADPSTGPGTAAAPGEPWHRRRDRAESFGGDAARYDRSRPRYPAALLDELLAGRPVRVLDVGCGTGILAGQLADRGCRVTGVEPDLRMAALARAKGIDVHVARFEDWTPTGRFDLVVSGQAWHWVDQAVGAAKVADLLLPGGRFAACWNLGRPTPAVREALQQVYRRVAPQLLNSLPLGMPVTHGRVAAAPPYLADPRLRNVRLRRYRWRRSYRTAEWVDQLPTHSDHRLLPAADLDRLLAQVTAVVDRCGGRVLVRYLTLAILADRD